MRLCLASTSPARLTLLRAAGIEPLTASPRVDEAGEAAAAGPLSPHDTVLLLARLKAEDVASRINEEHPGFNGLIIGGDSMFEIDGQVYGKPHTPEIATARWHAMRGRTGTLLTGHAVVDAATGRTACGVAATDVRFGTPSDAEVAAYVAAGAAFVRAVDVIDNQVGCS